MVMRVMVVMSRPLLNMETKDVVNMAVELVVPSDSKPTRWVVR